jgi:cytochrome c oxidase subunit II
VNSPTPVEQVDNAFYIIFGISGLIFIGIVVALIYFVIRYSRKRNPIPSRTRGNTLLEIIWTAVPLVIAMYMFYLGWHSYIGLRNVPENAIAITAKAMSFQWVFEYPNGKVSDSVLVVPEGQSIRVNIESSDVLHSLYIPAFRVKVDAIPGRRTYAWFYADKAGDYEIFCAVFCGDGHADMKGTLRILTQEEFDKWNTISDDDW